MFLKKNHANTSASTDAKGMNQQMEQAMTITVMAVLAVTTTAMVAFAAETEEASSGFNPADPTAAASHIEVIPEYNKGTDYKAPLLRLIYDIDWGDGKYSITTEIPYGRAEFDDGDAAAFGR